MNATIRRLAGVVFAALLSGGIPAAFADTAADRQKAVVTAAVERYIRPAHAVFEARVGALQGAVAAFCAAPDAGRHADVADNFRAAVEAWARLDFLRFGPATASARLERVAFWPDPRGVVERQLRQLLASPDLAGLDAVSIAGRSAAVQGLPALERLVVAIPAYPRPDDLARRCIVATAVTGNLVAIAAELADGWRGDSVLLLTPGPANPVYRSWLEAANEVLKASLTGLEQIRELALRPALGDAPDKAKPNRFPYARSGNALAYLGAAIAAQRELVERSGLPDGLPEVDDWVRRSLLFELEQAERTVASLAGHDAAALAGEPALRGKLDYVTIALASVRRTLAGPIAASLGLSVGFNALDGD